VRTFVSTSAVTLVDISEVLNTSIRRCRMSSEAIVVLVIVALAIAGLVYLEMHSRRSKKNEEGKSDE